MSAQTIVCVMLETLLREALAAGINRESDKSKAAERRSRKASGLRGNLGQQSRHSATRRRRQARGAALLTLPPTQALRLLQVCGIWLGGVAPRLYENGIPVARRGRKATGERKLTAELPTGTNRRTTAAFGASAKCVNGAFLCIVSLPLAGRNGALSIWHACWITWAIG